VQLKGGLAKVEVLVNAAGKVVFARILDAPPATTGPALEAAKKWTFTPPKFEGQPIQVLGVITFDVKSTSKDSKAKTKVASNEKKPN
jgi:outer membrane biosynthesis protein TonB